MGNCIKYKWYIFRKKSSAIQVPDENVKITKNVNAISPNLNNNSSKQKTNVEDDTYTINVEDDTYSTSPDQAIGNFNKTFNENLLRVDEKIAIRDAIANRIAITTRIAPNEQSITHPTTDLYHAQQEVVAAVQKFNNDQLMLVDKNTLTCVLFIESFKTYALNMYNPYKDMLEQEIHYLCLVKDKLGANI